MEITVNKKAVEGIIQLLDSIVGKSKILDNPLKVQVEGSKCMFIGEVGGIRISTVLDIGDRSIEDRECIELEDRQMLLAVLKESGEEEITIKASAIKEEVQIILGGNSFVMKCRGIESYTDMGSKAVEKEFSANVRDLREIVQSVKNIGDMSSATPDLSFSDTEVYVRNEVAMGVYRNTSINEPIKRGFTVDADVLLKTLKALKGVISVGLTEDYVEISTDDYIVQMKRKEIRGVPEDYKAKWDIVDGRLRTEEEENKIRYEEELEEKIKGSYMDIVEDEEEELEEVPEYMDNELVDSVNCQGRLKAKIKKSTGEVCFVLTEKEKQKRAEILKSLTESKEMMEKYPKDVEDIETLVQIDRKRAIEGLKHLISLSKTSLPITVFIYKGKGYIIDRKDYRCIGEAELGIDRGEEKCICINAKYLMTVLKNISTDVVEWQNKGGRNLFRDVLKTQQIYLMGVAYSGDVLKGILEYTEKV